MIAPQAITYVSSCVEAVPEYVIALAVTPAAQHNAPNSILFLLVPFAMAPPPEAPDATSFEHYHKGRECRKNFFVSVMKFDLVKFRLWNPEVWKAGLFPF